MSLATAKEMAEDLVSDPDKSYSHPQRKTRSDDNSTEAKRCIVEFCDSEDASRIDTNQFWSQKVTNIEGKEEKYPIRIWDVTRLEDKHKI